MSNLSKILFVSCTILLAALQLSATLLNWTAWPITSFNVFSSAPKDVWVIKAILANDQGDEDAVDPGQTLPVEFFKARSIYSRVFIGPVPQVERDRFARHLLDRLSDRGWVGIDETLSPATIAKPTGLRVEAWELDADQLETSTTFKVLRRRLVYQLPPPSSSAN